MHLFVLKNIFKSQDSTLTYSTFVTIPASYFCLYIITYLTFIKQIKTGIQKGLHMGYFDTILA